jgi:hypothetical protein
MHLVRATRGEHQNKSGDEQRKRKKRENNRELKKFCGDQNIGIKLRNETEVCIFYLQLMLQGLFQMFCSILAMLCGVISSRKSSCQ